MKAFLHRSAFSAFSAVAVASLAWASPVAAQPLPPASEVIAKYVTAIGGKDAIMKLTSMTSTGTLEIPAMGLTATMEVYAAAPNKMATRTTIPGMGEVLNGYNGTVGWDLNPMSGPRLLADKELEQMKENAGFHDNMLYTPERFQKMETVAVTDFNGEKAYKLLMVRKGSGTQSTQYFSVATGLLLGGETSSTTQMGEMQMSQSISEYKTFDGVKVPVKLEQTAGTNKMVITTSDVKFNAVPATAFDVPAQVKPLIKP